MDQREDYINWDEYYMAIAKVSAMRSKDPSSQVGAVIVSKDNRVLSIGYNGAPNGFNDEQFPWKKIGNMLDTKYAYVCHAEMNAISNYNGDKNRLNGAKIYVTLFPCNECSKLIIQSGIKEVIYASDKHKDSDQVKASKILLDTCGITYRQFYLPFVISIPENEKPAMVNEVTKDIVDKNIHKRILTKSQINVNNNK
jgi:dCMP deaminase